MLHSDKAGSSISKFHPTLRVTQPDGANEVWRTCHPAKHGATARGLGFVLTPWQDFRLPLLDSSSVADEILLRRSTSSVGLRITHVRALVIRRWTEARGGASLF